MDKGLYTCLKQLSKLGTPEWTTTEKAAGVVAVVKEQLAGRRGGEGGEVLDSTKRLLDSVDPTVRNDVRLECGCLAVALLHRTSELIGTSAEVSLPTSKAGVRRGVDPEAPPPPANLLSLQQAQDIAATARLALYTVVLASVDQEAARYIRVSLARAKFVLGPAPLEVPEGSRHSLLATTMRLLLPVVKHEALGTSILQSAYPEVLSALLCLCFCPATSKRHPEDTAYFRGQLETLTAVVESSVTLKHLLLLMGLVQGGGSGSSSSTSNIGRGGCSSGSGGGGRGWLGRTCNSLVVRRYLMAESAGGGGGGARAGGGLRGVVGAGLALCDGQDARRCQAVAALIAHARTPDLHRFYAALGPQVMEMLDHSSQLAPEVVRVVLLLAGELAERSPTLAAQYLGGPLLQPLTLTTSNNAPQDSIETSLTECVTRLHSVLVESAPPTPELARLLQPALCPLLALAAMPTTHLRTPSRHLLGRYLSHLSEGDVVDTLTGLAGLSALTHSPLLHPDVTLVLDGTGGVQVEARSHPPDSLQDDEARAACLSAILEDLGRPSVILAFYKKLVDFLDFQGEETRGKKSGPPIVCLKTGADEVASQFEQARRVAVCVGLLSCLAESEKLTGDLFQDLSAAGPVVDGLLRAGCQECQDEGLRDIQVSLVANVLVLVTCYISDRSLRGEMTSRDWAGLKALLPTLKLTEECLVDEGVRLMATQLRNMVATHGVVRTDPAAGDMRQERPEKKMKGKEKVGKKIEGKLSSVTAQHSKEISAAAPDIKNSKVKTSTTPLSLKDTQFEEKIYPTSLSQLQDSTTQLKDSNKSTTSLSQVKGSTTQIKEESNNIATSLSLNNDSTTQFKAESNKIEPQTRERGEDTLMKIEHRKNTPKESQEEKVEAGHKGDKGSSGKIRKIKEEKEEETEESNIREQEDTQMKEGEEKIMEKIEERQNEVERRDSSSGKVKGIKEEETTEENEIEDRGDTQVEELEEGKTVKMEEVQKDIKRKSGNKDKEETRKIKIEHNTEETDTQNTEYKEIQRKEKRVTNIRDTKQTETRTQGESSAFKSAMEDLMSPLLPIRGHGILALAKLLEEKDKETLEHGIQLLALFQHHLREDDSYLYLMAVRGLAALCDVLPEKAVGALTKEFSVGHRSAEDRAKLAESLSRAARRLGPLLAHYRNHFINAFLAGVRDPEWLVRAASLSALGDVCKELRFSLGPIVHEVFSVLYDAVAQDESNEVRRAAVLVVTLLLQGLGSDALKVLKDVVRDMYRVLRRLEATDPDPVVRLHAQLALQEVDGIMRRFLLPSTGLTKRIFVMDAPPPAL